MQDIIRFHTYEPMKITTEIESLKFEPNLTKWYQRLFLWIGRKLGIIYYGFDKVVKYKTQQIDLSDIKKAIAENKTNLLLMSQKRAKYVIVGRKQFEELHTQSANEIYQIQHLGTHRFEWYQPNPYSERYYGGMAQPPLKMSMDLQVIYVPYIDGCFVMPDFQDLNYERFC